MTEFNLIYRRFVAQIVLTLQSVVRVSRMLLYQKPARLHVKQRVVEPVGTQCLLSAELDVAAVISVCLC